MRRAAVLVAPFVRDRSGDQEGLPVVLMEAVGCGCPAVVADAAGIHDLLGESARELRVQPVEASSLAAAVSAVLANPEAARRRALTMRKRLLDTLDWDRVAAAYGNVLEATIT